MTTLIKIYFCLKDLNTDYTQVAGLSCNYFEVNYSLALFFFFLLS